MVTEGHEAFSDILGCSKVSQSMISKVLSCFDRFMKVLSSFLML